MKLERKANVRMKVVIDANVFISFLIVGKGNPRQIIDFWERDAFEICMSTEIFDEIKRVASYKRLTDKYPGIIKNKERIFVLLQKQARFFEPKGKLDIVVDESDNRYVECALESGAKYVVSGDDHLLRIKKYKNILILSPAEFIKLLESNYSPADGSGS